MRAFTLDSFDVPPGLRRIEDGDDLVASVADDAVRGLGMVGAELALGEDDQPAAVGGEHERQSTETRTPPGRGSGGVRGVFRDLVPHTGFEPVISALRGRCPGPLDECGPVGAGGGPPGRSA